LEVILGRSHLFLPKILRRVTEKVANRDFLTADYADAADEIFKQKETKGSEGPICIPDKKALFVFFVAFCKEPSV
jgi:hypothetical protein